MKVIFIKADANLIWYLMFWMQTSVKQNFQKKCPQVLPNKCHNYAHFQPTTHQTTPTHSWPLKLFHSETHTLNDVSERKFQTAVTWEECLRPGRLPGAPQGTHETSTDLPNLEKTRLRAMARSSSHRRLSVALPKPSTHQRSTCKEAFIPSSHQLPLN